MNSTSSKSRVRLILSAGVVASALLAGAGCSSISEHLGFARSDQPAAKPSQVAFAPEPVKKQQPASAENVLTSTQPRFENDWQGEDVTAVMAKPVNLFGEIGGESRGAYKEVGESGFQQHTFVDEGEDGDVSVDPTGKWIAFSSTRHSETGDIYLQRVDGSSVTQLTSDAARDAFPTFSPDGKWLAFSSTRSGTWQIYRMDLDGREVVQVTSGPLQAIHPSFSPDGTRLVYCALGARSQQWELWTVNLLSGERRQVGYGLFPTWSPDKTVDRIAYQKARQRGSRWFSLWTMDLMNGEGRRNTEVAVSSNAAIVSPCWSPDGKKLAFTTVVQPSSTGSVKGQQDVWTVEADGTNKHRLTDGNGSNLTPAWAADNRVYFISNRGGKESIWSVKASPVDTFTASAGKTATKPLGESAEAEVDTKEVTH